MRFFADREREEAPGDVAADVAAAAERARRLPAGPLRHAAVADALIRAGQLAQALADAADQGRCSASLARAALAETARLGRALWRSTRTGGSARAPEPRRLALPGAPALVRVRQPEGYALYALFPEAYGEAGRALRGERLTCIGVRSIGTGLAAMVAAGAGSRRPIFSVRPGGHPFARAVDPAQLRSAVAAGGCFAVVDEGPGLSGSTLAAVAQALLDAGVPEERIHLFTGHPHPPGPEAPSRVHALFARLPRHAAPLDELLAGPGPCSPASLARELVGPARAVADLGDGGWRRLVAAPWPPSTGWMERRKTLLEAGGVRWLARFAGLGGAGEAKLARAQALAEAGLGIAPAGLRHGFLFERWLEEARPAQQVIPRARLLEAVERLIRFCAGRPRPGGEGARPDELAGMARANAAIALGPEAAEAAARLEDLVPRVAGTARPVEVDARLQRWEWLALPDRQVVKTDGLDHHAGHELSGCQDVLWDVAGAQVELGLSEREARRLAERAREAGPGADPALLAFYRACYLAQELGRWWTAARAAPGGEERRRRQAAYEGYRRRLGEELAAPPSRPPRRAAAGLRPPPTAR